MNVWSKRLVLGAAVAIPLIGAMTLPVSAWQPSGQPAGQGGQPGGKARPERGGGGPGQEGAEGRRERDPFVEKHRDVIREHPRLGRALASLEGAKDYLEKAPNDFGGHKAASIKACEEAIAQLKQAIKFDAKQEGDGPRGNAEGGKGRGGQGGQGGQGGPQGGERGGKGRGGQGGGGGGQPQ
jgi:hypothetical protein